MEKVCFKTKKGPAALGPYSTATIYGGVIYLSGMIGVNPQTGKAPEGGTLAQAAQAFENIKTVLGELGADTADVLKTTVYLTNMADFGEVNKLYAISFHAGKSVGNHDTDFWVFANCAVNFGLSLFFIIFIFNRIGDCVRPET